MFKYSIVLLFAFCIVLFACNKEEYFKDSNHLVGDYDWVYSTVKNGDYIYGQQAVDYITNAEVSDKYGLRITEDGKLFFYKNENVVERYKFNHPVDLNDLTGDSLAFYGKNRKSGTPLRYNGDTLCLYDFPYEEDNYFIKQ